MSISLSHLIYSQMVYSQLIYRQMVYSQLIYSEMVCSQLLYYWHFKSIRLLKSLLILQVLIPKLALVNFSF